MQINNNDLEKQLRKLKTDIKNYDKEYYDLYSFYKEFSFYWKDGYSESFFALIEAEKRQFDLFFEELIRIYEILQEMNKCYSKYGNTIAIKEDTQKDILQKNKIIEKKYNEINNLYITILINKIDNIEIKEELNRIEKQIQYLDKLTLDIKDNYQRVYDNIIEKEKEVNFNLSRIEITKIKLNEFNKLPKSKTTSNKVGFFDGYDKKIEILKSVINEEQIYHEEIIEDIKIIISQYKSKNNNTIANLLILINNNFKTIHNNHINSINYLSKRIEKITEEVKKATKDIESIGDIKHGN